MQLNELEKLILGVTVLIRDEFGKSVLRTALVKYIYLIDVYSAELSDESKTLTGLDWKFHYFGPFASPVSQAIDNLVTKNLLLRNEGSEEDIEYSMYSIPDYSHSECSLTDLGIPSYVKVELRNVIQRYDHHLPELLNYVYYQTEPMRDAKSGDLLNFANCVKKDFASFKPITTEPIKKPKKQFLEKKKQLIKSLEARKQNVTNPFDGKFDEVYEQGLSLLDLDYVPVGLKGKAQLKTG